ncbi:hypothetical protein BHC44_09195 [Snodgrassella alvi]|jgi:hypothetical protein|nr:hypothetical protein BHC44_09195 [Snodgrassella alvi]
MRTGFFITYPLKNKNTTTNIFLVFKVVDLAALQEFGAYDNKILFKVKLIGVIDWCLFENVGAVFRAILCLI